MVSFRARGIIEAHDLAAASINTRDPNELVIVSGEMLGDLTVSS
jgi:hypothetical protein